MTGGGAKWWERYAAAVLPPGLGAAAFAVAFSRVQHLAAQHGQDGWRSYLIASTTEALALSAILEIRARRRLNGGQRAPWLVIGIGMAMSLAANVADRGPGLWGLLMAAWPVVAFGCVMLLKATRPTAPSAGSPEEKTTRTEVAPEPVLVSEVVPGPVPADVTDPGTDLGRGVPDEWSDIPHGPVVPDRWGPVEDQQKTSEDQARAAEDQDSMPLPDDIIRAAERAAEKLAEQGINLSRRTLTNEMRTAGQGIGTSRATALVALLEQRAADRSETSERAGLAVVPGLVPVHAGGPRYQPGPDPLGDAG